MRPISASAGDRAAARHRRSAASFRGWATPARTAQSRGPSGNCASRQRLDERTREQAAATDQLRALHPDIGTTVAPLDCFAALFRTQGGAGQEERLALARRHRRVPHPRARRLRGQTVPGPRGGAGRVDARMEPGADRGADPQAEAPLSPDVRAWQLRPRPQARAQSSLAGCSEFSGELHFRVNLNTHLRPVARQTS